MIDIQALINKAVQEQFKSFLIKAFYTINPDTKFLDNWHLDMITDALEKVRIGKVKRLIINVPPRSLKSICVSVAFPAWILAKNPAARIIVSSYSQTLSNKHSLDTRRVMQSDWYCKIFKDSQIIRGCNTKSKFQTKNNGYRFATSTGGTLTGEGGDFLIIDDPHSPVKIQSKRERQKVIDWFSNTFSSRLNDKKNGAMIVVMQRLHEEDLSGFLLDKGGWETIILPAINEFETEYKFDNNLYHKAVKDELLHKDREGSTEILRAKNDLGEYNFLSQYQQNPTASKGNLIQKKWIQFVDNLETSKKELKFLSIDTANCINDNNDFSAIAEFTECRNNVVLSKIWREKLEYPELKKFIINLLEKSQYSAVLIEAKSSGLSLFQDLKTSMKNLNIISITPKNNKEARAMFLVSAIESGNLKFFQPNFTATLENELLKFPNSKHDDQIDAISQFINWYRQIKPIIKPRVGVL
jgi:predicted phage terminase large subunit-like protein